MTGVWEKRLQNIAYGQEFSMPAASQLIGSMEDLTLLLDRAAQEPGVTGKSGEAATKSLSSASQRARAIASTTHTVQRLLEDANAVRTGAQQDLAGLSSGTLSRRDELIVRAAAAGATIFFPGFSIVAGEGAVSLVNWFLGNNREESAKKAVQAASERLDQIDFPQDLDDGVSGHDSNRTKDGASGPGDGSSGGGPRGGSFGRYPDAGRAVIDHGHLPDGLKIDHSHPDSGVGIGRPQVGTPGGSNPGSVSDADSLNPLVVGPGQQPPWTTGGDGIGGGLTPNGATTGGTTWGTPPSGVGSSVGGGYAPGSGSGLLGSVATGGAVAGTSGAALFGGAKLAHGAGFAGAGGVSGAAGGGVGTSGGAVAGGLGGRGGAAGAARTGGLLGGTRASQASAASSASGSAAGSRSGVVGAGGRPGAAGGRDRDRQEGRGLGGPIAPHLEDDADRGPRSEAAGAGGRE